MAVAEEAEMIKLPIHLAWAFLGNFIHAAIIAFPLWWALNRLAQFVGVSVSYWDALAVAIAAYFIRCAWVGVTTKLEF